MLHPPRPKTSQRLVRITPAIVLRHRTLIQLRAGQHRVSQSAVTAPDDKIGAGGGGSGGDHRDQAAVQADLRTWLRHHARPS
jgi:hypothetical protein